MTPSVALSGQTAFAAPSAWPKGLSRAEEVVITTRANSLTQSGGRTTTTRRSGNVFMMAKKVTKRPVSKGFGAAPKIKGNLIVLEDKATVDLFDWLKSGGASVSKVAIAEFKGLRGVAGDSYSTKHIFCFLITLFLLFSLILCACCTLEGGKN